MTISTKEEYEHLADGADTDRSPESGNIAPIGGPLANLPAEIEPRTSITAGHQAINFTESENMNFRQMAVTAVLGAGAATALSGAGAHDYSDVKFQPNPNPKDRYELTVKVDGAPGLFKHAVASTTLQIANPDDCLPPRDPFTGAWPRDAKDVGGVAVNLTQISAVTWRGEFSVDGLLEAPYYGRAACRWNLTVVHVSLMATGAKGETVLSAYLNLSQVREEKAVALYFHKDTYTRGLSIPVLGEIDRSRFNPDVTDADLFTITLSARKVAP